MKKLISCLIALISFVFFSCLFSRGDDGFSLSSIQPIQAFQGITFTLAFGLGLPIWLSYVFAILVLLGLPTLIYKLILKLLVQLTK